MFVGFSSDGFSIDVSIDFREVFDSFSRIGRGLEEDWGRIGGGLEEGFCWMEFR